jgi:subtilase family serine protease
MVLSISGAEPGRTGLPEHFPAVATRRTPTGRLPAQTNLSLAIGLPLRNRADLDGFLGQLQDPHSTNYHQYLTPDQFTRRFGPTEEEYQAVTRFAVNNGLKISGTHPNRLVLDVEGSVSNIERAFQITLHTYRHPKEPRDFFAPDAEPSVPANLPVIDVEGLSDYGRPRPLARALDLPKIRPLSFNGSGPNGEYAGRDFRNAYAPGTTLTGTGQTVGLLEFSAYFQSDVVTYERIIGLTNLVPLNNVVIGHPAPSAANNLEVALDIEMAIAMAPGLSQVIVYEENAINPVSMLNRMATDNLAKQLSSSWSWSGGPTNPSVDGILLQMAAQGQSYFQASGDSDAYTGANVLDNPAAPLSPIDSTNLTVVGGTSLVMNGAGASWASEAVWNYNTNGIANEGSGGGISLFYRIPWWQTNISMTANHGSTTFRNIPDVALTADNIFACFNNGNTNGSSYVMGTSCAAPLWAGFCALINQQSVASSGKTVGFLNPALYAIGTGTNYSACFNDITASDNIGTNSPGLFQATPGYDLCTGLGTPRGTSLINALAPFPFIASPPASRTATNGNTVTFSVGTGGQSPFSYRWLFNGTNLSAGGNISGNTSNILTIASVSSTNAGNYRVIVTNNYGSVTSSTAVLTVVFPPAFTAQPTNQTVVAGANAVFSATVSGALPLTYQWRKNGTNLLNGGNVSGATSNVLTISTVTSVNAGNYALVATNIYGSATSQVATLTLVQPPAITLPPTNQTIQCGSNASFSVAATGTAPLSYRWSLDNVGITTATNTSLLLTNVHLPNHMVSVVITNLYGSVTSSATLNVQDTLPPVIVLNGANPMYVELGSTFTDPGATANDLCAGSVGATASGTVNTGAVSTNTVTYMAGDGNGNTGIATRTVIVRDTTPPAISWSFTNLTLAAGTNCSAEMPDVTGTNFILATDLSGPLTISQDPTNGTVLPLGTNSAVLTVSDASGNSASSTNQIVVEDQTPPLIVAQPQNQTNSVGSSALFSVAATACTPLTFQWFFNNTALADQTNSTLTLSNLTSAAAGNYFAVATASGGSTTSVVATLTVNILVVKPVIISVTGNVDGAVTMNLTGTAGSTYILQATTNLSEGTWLPLATNALDTNGVWQFTDVDATNFPQRFYRSRLVP